MSNLTICDRTSGQSSRRLIKDVQLSEKVSNFRSKVSRLLDLPIHEIELIYRGVCLKDDALLDSYGLGESSTVHILKKAVAVEQAVRPEPMDSAAVQQVVTALQAALMNPAHRNTVDTMMSRPETMENLIAATPGLDQDPVALAMIQDPELLAILADPENIHRVIEAHPSLGHAASLVAAAINEEGAKSGAQGASGSSRATYSLDQMSDDEDLPGPSSAAAQAQQPITASQLAAALAMAGGSANQQPASAPPSSSTTSDAGGMITGDLFQRAMMEVTGGMGPTPSGGATGQQPSENVTAAALQQLRDMGITDEARARQALSVTGGNIQAALEILFGDDL